MKPFKIAHLYYDLMNLYGERGNILALEHHLKQQGIPVTITNLSLDEKKEFDHYDLFYIGSGNEEAFFLALKDLLTYQEDLKKAYLENKFFLITGNALNLFGKSYTSLKNTPLKALHFFDYEAFETDFRIVGEQTMTFAKFENPIIGFQNRNSVLKFVKEPHLFDMVHGTGYIPKSICEGILKNHFYGTYTLGPLLIRNPHFTEYLVQEITSYLGIPYTYYENPWEEKAYQEYKKNLLQD